MHTSFERCFANNIGSAKRKSQSVKCVYQSSLSFSALKDVSLGTALALESSQVTVVYIIVAAHTTILSYSVVAIS